MDYLELFPKIDKNKDGVITRRDLFKYALGVGDVSMVDRWFTLFDSRDKGIITIDDVSRILGVPPPKFYNERNNRRISGMYDSDCPNYKRRPTSEFRSTEDMTKFEEANIPLSKRSFSTESVQLKSINPLEWNKFDSNDENDMKLQSIYKQISDKLTTHLKKALNQNLTLSMLPQFIALELEKEFGRNWQVIIGPNKLGCAVAHLQGKFANIIYHTYHIIAFQTLDF